MVLREYEHRDVRIPSSSLVVRLHDWGVRADEAKI